MSISHSWLHELTMITHIYGHTHAYNTHSHSVTIRGGLSQSADSSRLGDVSQQEVNATSTTSFTKVFFLMK